MNSYKYILFDLGGNLENSVYPGTETLLAGLKSAGKTLIVATSKGVHGTEVVLNHFGLKKTLILLLLQMTLTGFISRMLSVCPRTM